MKNKSFLVQLITIENYHIKKIDLPKVISSLEIKELATTHNWVQDKDFNSQFPESISVFSEPNKLTLKSVNDWLDREPDCLGIIIWKEIKKS